MANSQKKVLFLITKATWGGAQRYVYDLVTHLSPEEFKCAIAFGVPGRLSQLVTEKGISIRRLPSLGRDIALISDIKSFSEIRHMLREARPDIVHLNSSKAAALGALAGRLSGVPRIVFTVHGWPFKESRNALTRGVIYMLSWLTALLSHAVITVSDADTDAGKRMWGVGHKIQHIPLGLESVAQKTPAEAYRSMFGTLLPAPLTPETIRLVSLAELTRNKGIRYAIEAVALLRDRSIDAIYVVAGDGEERPSLEKLAGKLGVSDRIFLPGFIPDAAHYLTGFDIYVLPSVKEGTPYVTLEADTAGLPIVATSVIDATLFERFSLSRNVPPADPLALADAIEELATAPRNTGSRNFPLAPMVERTRGVYVPETTKHPEFPSRHVPEATGGRSF
ncbi:glycosyltransferase [Candidatus Kaiserbacteria bacterium]|nr:glycosyltransferase [Candidatus Kaiserbacteria bacterium]